MKCRPSLTPDVAPSLEFLLTLIKSRKAEGVEPQLIALSAVLGDLGGLDSWLEAHLLRRTERPVPLDEGVLELSGTYRYMGADGVAALRTAHPAPVRRAAGAYPLDPAPKEAGKRWPAGHRHPRHPGRDRGAARYLADSLGLPPARRP